MLKRYVPYRPLLSRFISHILGVFASSADVAKGGDGAKSAWREISLLF
jgi:hypothetical protein